MSSNIRVVILPGNGCTDVYNSNWYGWMQMKLEETKMFSEVILENMPDPYEAKSEIWLPFIKDVLKADMNTIIIGHSSGAVACMRYLENEKLFGCVLVSTCYTDLGEENERISNYYNKPWKWDEIKNNCRFILQYHSTDDPFIPISEANYVSNQLSSNYKVFNNRSHFFEPKDVKEIINELKKYIN